MKTLLLSLLIITISSFTTPDKTSKKILKIIKSGDVENIEQYYLTKDEFISLLEEMDPKPPEEQTKKMIENYDAGKEAFLASFEQSIEVVDWSSSKIDSTQYDYVIAKPGSDEKILWPESKNYQINDADLVKVILSISLHDNKNTCLMKLEMMNYQGKWKLIYWLKPLYIQAITED